MSEPKTERRGAPVGAASSRRRGREVALQVLYSIDLATAPRRISEEPLPEVAEDARRAATEQAFTAVAEHFEVPAGASAFARELVEQVRSHASGIDEIITAHAQNWRIPRMAAVDRNILRLATYELAYTSTPPAVVLNEAVDLARRFGSDPSPAFVNGILDAVARGLAEARP